MFIENDGIMKRLPSQKLDQPRTEKKDTFSSGRQNGLSLSTLWCCAVVFLRLLYTKQVEF